MKNRIKPFVENLIRFVCYCIGFTLATIITTSLGWFEPKIENLAFTLAFGTFVLYCFDRKEKTK